MATGSRFRIAVMAGDGIGIEVMEAGLAVLDAVAARIPAAALDLVALKAGAGAFLAGGAALPVATLEQAGKADAVLLGAMGLPDVRYPDGTEMVPQIDLRDHFELFAGVRPVRLVPGAPTPLADARAADIDFVLIREQTEGLFAERAGGTVNDEGARDSLVVTRAGSERLFDFAFALAAQRRADGHPGHLTLVDKANVLRSMAWLRERFDDAAARHREIETAR